MKVHTTDENGDFSQTIEVNYSVVLEIEGGHFFELECISHGELQVWGGRRPWIASSKDVVFQNQWKSFSIEPGAANVIRITLKD